jgi:hypothetical protein
MQICNRFISAGLALLLSALLGTEGLFAQENSAAIPAESPEFAGWAVSCELERGPGLITYPDSIEVSFGEASHACGIADKQVVSLGDGGIATLRFSSAIGNGPGPDFAVFENSFDGAFLELAFVEVSSDGEHFIRFPASSLTPSDEQVGPFGTLDPGDINNLAGRDAAGWGTPFDLEELSDSSLLDISSVLAVRLVDVIGIVDETMGSRDASGRLVNDPFPTPFASCGFDLDAVGVIHTGPAGLPGKASRGPVQVYPVPCGDILYLEIPGAGSCNWTLLDMQGRERLSGSTGDRYEIDLGSLPGGIYLFRCDYGKGVFVKRIIKTAG